MKEINDALAALKQAGQNLRDRGNAALKEMPALESLAVGREILSGLSCLQWSVNEVENILRMVSGIAEKLPAEVDSYVAAKVTAGELVLKDVMEGAVAAAKSAAKNEGIKEVEDRIAAEKQREGLVASRRQDLAAIHGESAVAALSVDVLASDDFDTVVKGEFARRFTALCEIGIKPDEKPEVFGKIACASAFDDAGKTVFDATVAAVTAASGVTPKTGSTGSVAASKGGGTKPGSSAPTITNPRSGGQPDSEGSQQKQEQAPIFF